MPTPEYLAALDREIESYAAGLDSPKARQLLGDDWQRHWRRLNAPVYRGEPAPRPVIGESADMPKLRQPDDVELLDAAEQERLVATLAEVEPFRIAVRTALEVA